ncbi:arylsulfatase B-like [Oratosquilla oratoria]|uniref:arylsulfatase B-like n=1 Tax=Oratosquilla oratoria TaxID=337810 RepID=UPI003F775FC5
MTSHWMMLLVVLSVSSFHTTMAMTTTTPADSTHNPAEPSSSTSSKSSKEKKPNILLIVADDLGWNDVPWHNRDIVAPNILELARDGIILDRSYVQPICTPSRSALMSGMYPFTIGRQSGVIRPMEPVGLTMEASPLLPEILKDLGYSTHAVGKWHLGFCDWKYTPTERGFDTFFGYYNGAEGYFSHWRSDLDGCNMCSFDNMTKYGAICENADVEMPEDCKFTGGYDFRRNKEPDFSVNGTYSTHAFASYVENLLDTRNSEEPFFLYMPFQSVHSPLEVPENYTEPYKHIHTYSRRIYCGMVTAMDEAIGRMVAALKRTGQYNNTIIVFTTDNGGPVVHSANNWPLRGAKTTYWEGGTRGSAFLHSPLLPQHNFVSNKLLHIVDWYPTLVGLAGGKVEDHRDGVDIWEAIISPNASIPSPRTDMVYNIDYTHDFRAAVRIGDYKLIVGNPGEGDWTPVPKVSEGDPIIPKNITESEDQEDKNEEYEKKNGDEQREEEIENFEVKAEMREDEHENSIYFMKELDIDIDLITNKIPFKSLSYETQHERKERMEKSQKSKDYLKKEMRIKKTKQQYRFIDSKKNSPSSPVILDIENQIFNTEKFDVNSKEMTNAEHLISKNGKPEERPTSMLPTEEFGIFEEENKIDEITPGRNKSFKNITQQIQTTYDFPTLEEFIEFLKKDKTKMQLYNVQDDPEERVDLSNSLNDTVLDLISYLFVQLERYVPADNKKPNEKANPKYWNRVWTPGWC